MRMGQEATKENPPYNLAPYGIIATAKGRFWMMVAIEPGVLLTKASLEG